ncbi:hypothetical protein MCOR24_009025 [Pyricularia oryzae]|nr:hypothetical protein MCOR24_009025 [Pyricularia oryzae]KAI6554378.1 hypothetical protein MCOR09_010317 [Pyricularia oryzae]
MAFNKEQFKVYSEQCNPIFGTSPSLELLYENPEYPFAHEAGVFIAQDNTLFVTSNQFKDPATGQRTIKITRVCLPADRKCASVVCEEVEAPDVPMANGGVNYRDGILFCAQGTLTSAGGLVLMEAKPPHKCSSIISSFHGRPFNSVNDVVVHSDGSLWFTDPIYGYEQGIRPKPRLPSQVYRFEPATGSIRAMADGFQRPNGICFSPDEKTVYLTDTDWIHGDGTTDDARVSHIYAFDVTLYSGQPFLTNRRLFAMADAGVPDGIKCDTQGNVYSGCGDGVHIWSPGGVLLGKILVDGGVANFCFGVRGELFLLSEHKIWRAQLHGDIKGDLLRI